VAVEAINATIWSALCLTRRKAGRCTGPTNNRHRWSPKGGPGDRQRQADRAAVRRILPWRGFFRHLTDIDTGRLQCPR